ncbi:MAG: endonuclease NucS [Candidatus Aminicenantes bacterium]|nr:endonuclease NucS [Candidatus Aminicenantes bacterium]
MGTEIKSWQIINGELSFIKTTLKIEGRTEPYDLEPWLASNPEIISKEIVIIGRQIATKTGIIDLLGLDSAGNTIIIEIKRDELPREALAQAIDYASVVASWTVEHLGEICSKHTKKSLEDVFKNSFPDADLEAINLNSTQRIFLVGFSIESSLERMIEWLSDTYSVNINAIVLSYIKTKSGDELLTKTSIISEELEQERVRKQKKFEILMSDEPGDYDISQLKQLLIDYLSRDEVTNRRIRDILLPALLKKKTLTREQLKKEFIEFDKSCDESKVGYYLTPISSQLGMEKNDFLRQVVFYDYPRHKWEKDNFTIREQYRELVKEVLELLIK